MPQITSWLRVEFRTGGPLALGSTMRPRDERRKPSFSSKLALMGG
jgi:hypothetical protein